MSENIEKSLRASDGKYVMIQPRPGVAFNIPTYAPADDISFDGEHPFPTISRQQDQQGRVSEGMVQIPILMGTVAVRGDVVWLRILDQGSNSGRYLLIALDPAAILAVSVLSDEPAKELAPPPEPSRILVP